MQRSLAAAVILAFSSAAIAQGAHPPDPAVPPVQAPPPLTDPGMVSLPSPQAEAAKAVSDSAANDVPEAHIPATDANAAPAEKPLVATHPLPPEVQAAAEASELAVITVRAQGAETVEEYRKKGNLYFVRVISSSGPPKFYVDNPNAVPPNIMQQISGPSGVVQPVYFKLADWK